MSFYWKARTLISGDYREIERNVIEYKNKKAVKKYEGKKDIYCVIRLHSDEGGLFCLWLKALEGIRYSLQNGYIPVIDMQTKENIFTTKKERKQENIWETFFNQPVDGVRYQDVKKYKNKVIIENPMGPDYHMVIQDEDVIKYWRTLVKKYITYSDKAQASIDEYAKVFGDGEKTLGVLARGTDYLNPALGHLTKLGIPEIIRQTELQLEKYGYERVFLATEDSNILDAMKAHFGDKLLYIEQKRYSGVQADKLGHLKDYAKDAVEMNISYLTAMHYLSRCRRFWGSNTTGSKGAFLMRAEGYDSFEMWQQPLDVEKFDINKL